MVAARAAGVLAAKPQIIEEKRDDSRTVKEVATKRTAAVKGG